MKIYTKTGDKGLTLLANGKQVLKNDIRVEAYGTIDELQSFMGMLASMTDISQLDVIQDVLFAIGGYLANDCVSSIENLDENISQLEQQIDRLQERLPALRVFLVPGGILPVSICHVCRTVCRRAERRIITLNQTIETEMDSNVLIYINRLSDYFFLLARYLNLENENIIK